jgi:hypothetical protein
MTTRPKQQSTKLPFWKRWLFQVWYIVSIIVSLLFIGMTIAMPFMYNIEGKAWGFMVYAMGMSLVLALIAADSARRIYRRLYPK